MTKLWKWRLCLIALTFIGIAVMAYYLGHEPESMQSKLLGCLGSLVFFMSAIVLLYTSEDNVPSSYERQKKSKTDGTTIELSSRSTGGSGGSSGC